MFKKVLAVGFSAVLALSLVACGGSKDNKSKSSKEKQQQAKARQQQFIL